MANTYLERASWYQPQFPIYDPEYSFLDSMFENDANVNMDEVKVFSAGPTCSDENEYSPGEIWQSIEYDEPFIKEPFLQDEEMTDHLVSVPSAESKRELASPMFEPVSPDYCPDSPKYSQPSPVFEPESPMHKGDLTILASPLRPTSPDWISSSPSFHPAQSPDRVQVAPRIGNSLSPLYVPESPKFSSPSPIPLSQQPIEPTYTEATKQIIHNAELKQDVQNFEKYLRWKYDMNIEVVAQKRNNMVGGDTQLQSFHEFIESTVNQQAALPPESVSFVSDWRDLNEQGYGYVI